MVLPVGVAVLLIGAPQLMPSLSVSVLRFESSAAAAAAALSRATSDFFFLLVGPPAVPPPRVPLGPPLATGEEAAPTLEVEALGVRVAAAGVVAVGLAEETKKYSEITILPRSQGLHLNTPNMLISLIFIDLGNFY